MKNIIGLLCFTVLLLLPGYASAQSSPERITLYDNFDELEKGERFFIFGSLANVLPDSYLITEIINPNGDLCQIQQIFPLSNGLFITESIPMAGKICGVTGKYEAKVFYGKYSTKKNFSVISQKYQEITSQDSLDLARQTISDKIHSQEEKGGPSMLAYSQRLDGITSSLSSSSSQLADQSIAELQELYADLWNQFFIEEDIYGLDPKIRPAVEGALDTTAELIESGKLSLDVAKGIDRETFAAIFYSKIGDSKNAISKLNDVFVLATNVDPIKVPKKNGPQSFVDLEDTLLNLMKKTQSVMSKPVKEEIAFIFSRGTGPLYADEINQMVDLLTKSRFLDVILRNDNDLYGLVQNEWEFTKTSLTKKESMEKLLELKDQVDKIHQATLLLRSIDNVDRFITSDEEENSDLANLISPEWEKLQSSLQSASSVDNIIVAEQEINDMKSVIDASTRISKTVEISKKTNLNSETISGWKVLLDQVEEAQSVTKILDIVSEFDKSITELREKRNPISILRFEYEAMKAKAELQADSQNLYLIENALKILDTAQSMEQTQKQPGLSPASKIDRIEVLLTWASTNAPEIKAELDSYSQDAYKIRASDILQRAKSLENLVDLSLRKNKFLPGYVEFTDSMKDRINAARDVVIHNDLDSGDKMVRTLFSEWQEVSGAYAADPYGSDVGYTADELKRIEYRKNVETLSDAVKNFYNADFEPYSNEYVKMIDDAYELIEYGNFIDAESKIREIGAYMSEHLALNNKKIIYDIIYDQEKDFWIISGAVDKPVMDRREDLYVTIYEKDGSIHSSLEFTDTRQGEFYTQWEAPTKPGMYIVMLQYQNSKASQIVYIEEERKYTNGIAHTTQEQDIVEMAREFEEIRTFIEKFGSSNDSKFDAVMDEIKTGLAKRDSEKVKEGIDELKRLVERYLPVRSKAAVIEAQLKDGQLYISGAVQKTLSFSEDLFVDIYDQRGQHVDEIALKDSSSGHFNNVAVIPLTPGLYVAQLQYHNMVVSDFFTVNG